MCVRCFPCIWHRRKLRHERVQREKRVRDERMAMLREQLQGLNPSVRPGSSSDRESIGKPQEAARMLPSIDRQAGNGGGARGRKKSPLNYREVMEAIGRLQRERASLADPYAANLKVRALQNLKFDHTRSRRLDRYLCVSMSPACATLAKHQRPRTSAGGLH